MDLKYSFKAVDRNLHTSCGGGYTYEIGKWHETVPNDKNDTVFCHRWGFHSARNPLACIDNFGSCGSRFFIVEVGGDIDEEDGMLCSTKIKLVKEISLEQVIAYGLKYICEHPNVDSTSSVKITEKFHDNSGNFVIVRGKNPIVKARSGTVVGLLKEKEDNAEIEYASMWIVGKNGYKANQYYSA